MKIFRILPLLLWVAALLPVHDAAAMDTHWASWLDFRGAYEDNARMTSASHSSVFASLIEPGLSCDASSETGAAHGELVGRLNHYSGDTALDSHDLLARFEGHTDTERNRLSLGASYRLDSTLGNQLEQTGLVLARQQKREAAINADWKRTLTERTSITLGAEAGTVGYETAGGSPVAGGAGSAGLPLVGFSTWAVSITPKVRFGESDSTSLRVRSWDMVSDETPASQFRMTSVEGGWEHAFTERWQLTAWAGAGATRSRPRTGSQSNASTLLADLRIEWRFDTGAVALSGVRQVFATGLDDLSASSKLVLGWAQALSPTLRLALDAGEHRNHFFAGAVNPADSRYAKVAGALSWQAREKVSLGVGASHAAVSYGGTGGSVADNVVYVNIRWSVGDVTASPAVFNDR
jgi:hypothetical protein